MNADNIEQQYLDLMTQVLDADPEPRRNGHACRAIPSATLFHDMAFGFPLLTTKKVHFKSIAVELQGFINGITNATWYQERGCRIWNEWAKSDGDLGPIYGYQWRAFDEPYMPEDSIAGFRASNEACDQLSTVIRTLKTDPSDRRMVCMAWNPLQVAEMALPACHIGWMVTVINGYLHLTWFQRSCDLFLGIPFNLASYALLLQLLSNETGIPVGTLTGHLVNVHLYENQIDQAREQVSRTPYDLPTLDCDRGVYDFDYKTAKIIDYKHHPVLKARVAI